MVYPIGDGNSGIFLHFDGQTIINLMVYPVGDGNLAQLT